MLSNWHIHGCHRRRNGGGGPAPPTGRRPLSAPACGSARPTSEPPPSPLHTRGRGRRQVRPGRRNHESWGKCYKGIGAAVRLGYHAQGTAVVAPQQAIAKLV
jgi:hypothetical protein